MALKYGTNNVTSVVVDDTANKISGSGGAAALDIKEIIKDGTVVWEKPYTLTISVTGSSYIKSYSVNRTATLEPTSTTSVLTSGATIYYKDTLATSVTAADTRYGSWSTPTLSAPTFGMVTATSISVSNDNTVDCTLYYGTSAGATTYSRAISAGGTVNITGLTKNTTYYFKLYNASMTRTRSYWTRSASASPVSISSVSSNATIIFTGTESSAKTERGTVAVTSANASKATVQSYKATIGATTYCKSAYLSTASTATSGSASGTYFDAGTTVYLFVELNDDTAQYKYTAPSGWVNISGRKYRVASVTLTSSDKTFDNVSATRTTQQYAVTISSTNCTANKSSGTYDYGTVITWTASSGYAYNSSGTTTETKTITGAGTYSSNPGYVYLTLNTIHCTYIAGDPAGWYEKGADISTGFGADTYWSYVPGTARRATEVRTVSNIQEPTTLASGPAYCYGTISYTRCSNSSYSTGYRAPGTFVVTADTNYRFTTGSATITLTWSENCSLAPSADYMNTTISGSYCTANKTSGWLPIGTTINWTPNTNYRFNTASPTKTTAAGTFSYSNAPDQVYCTISGIGCTADKSTDWYDVSTTITWTGMNNSGVICRFVSSGKTTTEADTTQATVALGTTSYSRSTSYTYYNVSWTCSYCTANYTSGQYFLSGTLLIWTADANYSFNGSSVKDTYSETVRYSQGLGTIAPGYVKCTISATNCTANKTSGSILATGTTITWTATTGYHFGSSQSTTTSTANVALGTTSYSKSATINTYTVTLTPSAARFPIYYRKYTDPTRVPTSWQSTYEQINVSANYNTYIDVYAPASGGFVADDTYTSSSSYKTITVTSTQNWAPTGHVPQYTLTLTPSTARPTIYYRQYSPTGLYVWKSTTTTKSVAYNQMTQVEVYAPAASGYAATDSYTSSTNPKRITMTSNQSWSPDGLSQPYVILEDSYPDAYFTFINNNSEEAYLTAHAFVTWSDGGEDEWDVTDLLVYPGVRNAYTMDLEDPYTEKSSISNYMLAAYFKSKDGQFMTPTKTGVDERR